MDVGAAVTATDADAGDNLRLGGADMASFDFVGTTGQIRTKSGVSYDHEAKASYTVTVTASDGTSTTDASVTISVTDVDEPPSAPATPMVSAVSGSTTSLSVSWAAPANAGKPAIASYDVQYRVGSSGTWTDGPASRTSDHYQPRREHRPAGARHQRRGRLRLVRPARLRPDQRADQQRPGTGDARARNRGEHRRGRGRRRRGDGTDADAGDNLSYMLGSDMATARGRHQVTTGTTTTVHDRVTGRRSLRHTLYEARVRASNAEGDSGWSDPPGSGRTNAPTNNAPVFSPAMPEREIAENTAAGVDVGAAVTATDADAGDNLSYMLGGADMASFDFVGTTGQIRTKSGVSYDHEAKASYTVTVTASDGTSTTDASVTISVTDVDEPPSAPATPMVSAVSGSTTSLSVSWAAPANAGKPAIASYDVQYRVGSSGTWTDGPVDVTDTDR